MFPPPSLHYFSKNQEWPSLLPPMTSSPKMSHITSWKHHLDQLFMLILNELYPS